MSISSGRMDIDSLFCLRFDSTSCHSDLKIVLYRFLLIDSIDSIDNDMPKSSDTVPFLKVDPALISNGGCQNCYC